jgi:methyl-accepting chemotaxis protein
MGNRGYRRRRVLVDKSLQVGLALRVVMWLATYLVLFCLMSVTAPLLTALVTKGESFIFSAAMSELLGFGKRLLLPLGLTFLALALHCTLMLHRIAGPVYRVKLMLGELGNGNLADPMKFRDGDFINDVADAYNDMLASVRSDVEQLKEQCDTLVSRAQESEDTAVLDQAVAMQQLLDCYKTSREDAPVLEPMSDVEDTAEAPTEVEAQA